MVVNTLQDKMDIPSRGSHNLFMSVLQCAGQGTDCLRKEPLQSFIHRTRFSRFGVSLEETRLSEFAYRVMRLRPLKSFTNNTEPITTHRMDNIRTVTPITTEAVYPFFTSAAICTVWAGSAGS